ncbi:hypothetical protein J4447_00230 [Candidatus Pacearchaeota archaeon]|nr:hypothetical protein [Candidatus Pacearchaeota archaeon]
MSKDFSGITKGEFLRIAPGDLDGLDAEVGVRGEGTLSVVYFLRNKTQEPRGDASLRAFYRYLLREVEGECTCVLGLKMELMGEKTACLSQIERNNAKKFMGVGRKFIEGLLQLLVSRGRKFLILTPISDALETYYASLGYAPYAEWTSDDKREIDKDYTSWSLGEEDLFDINKQRMMMKKIS